MRIRQCVANTLKYLDKVISKFGFTTHKSENLIPIPFCHIFWLFLYIIFIGKFPIDLVKIRFYFLQKKKIKKFLVKV